VSGVELFVDSGVDDLLRKYFDEWRLDGYMGKLDNKVAVITGGSMPSQAQKALKIFMVPKFTGAAYFAATEKGAKEAVAELKGKGVAIDFLYTGPSVANTDEEIRLIDDLVAQKPDAIIISPNNADAMVPVAERIEVASAVGRDEILILVVPVLRAFVAPECSFRRRHDVLEVSLGNEG